MYENKKPTNLETTSKCSTFFFWRAKNWGQKPTISTSPKDSPRPPDRRIAKSHEGRVGASALTKSLTRAPGVCFKFAPHKFGAKKRLGVLVQKSIQIQQCFFRHATLKPSTVFTKPLGFNSDHRMIWKIGQRKEGFIVLLLKKNLIENHEIPNVKRQQGKGVKV